MVAHAAVTAGEKVGNQDVLSERKVDALTWDFVLSLHNSQRECCWGGGGGRQSGSEVQNKVCGLPKDALDRTQAAKSRVRGLARGRGFRKPCNDK
jgi:hypothetical protein